MKWVGEVTQSKKVVQVAVAILQRNSTIFSAGKFLMASRPDGKGWAGWWEFPGGKVEAGESPVQALSRELEEELGIIPTQIQAWLTRHFEYPATHDAIAKTVQLHFYFVTKWQGHLNPREGQQLRWQSASHTTVSPVLPANAPIMHALALPPIYAISNMAEMGETAFLGALESQLKQGLSLIQIREKQLERTALSNLVVKIQQLAKPYAAKILLNADIALAQKLGVDGVHLISEMLMNCQAKPDGLMVAASCHDPVELAHAEKLGLDFVVLSPVNMTKSHENAKPLGWSAFEQLIQNCNIPVYALGGMQMSDLSLSFQAGARGIAMQRAIWGV
ncbi:MAG: Nudix family hydrolase [Pseudomonadota bacterium]